MSTCRREVSIATADEVGAGSAVPMTTRRATYQIACFTWKGDLDQRNNKNKELKVDWKCISSVRNHNGHSVGHYPLLNLWEELMVLKPDAIVSSVTNLYEV